MISVRAPEETKARLEKAAEALNLPLSTLLRQLGEALLVSERTETLAVSPPDKVHYPIWADPEWVHAGTFWHPGDVLPAYPVRAAVLLAASGGRQPFRCVRYPAGQVLSRIVEIKTERWSTVISASYQEREGADTFDVPQNDEGQHYLLADHAANDPGAHDAIYFGHSPRLDYWGRGGIDTGTMYVEASRIASHKQVLRETYEKLYEISTPTTFTLPWAGPVPDARRIPFPPPGTQPRPHSFEPAAVSTEEQLAAACGGIIYPVPLGALWVKP